MDLQTQKPAPKPKKTTYINDNLIETFRDVGRGIGKTIKDDVVKGIASDALSSLFGTPKSGDMQPGQSISLGQKPQQQAPQAKSPPLANPDLKSPFLEKFPFRKRKQKEYIPSVSQETMNLLRQKEQEMQKKVEEVRVEIKQLIVELKGVDKEIKNTVETRFVNPGDYHINLLDRIKASLKLMLIEMKQSNNWLKTSNSKRKKQGYWKQAKKKGTEWMLNNERQVATQVG